jgi:hypothetical protein
MAKLYAAGPVHVARGPHSTASGFDTWTLASPYPDAALARLSPGTLLLVFAFPTIIVRASATSYGRAQNRVE